MHMGSNDCVTFHLPGPARVYERDRGRHASVAALQESSHFPAYILILVVVYDGGTSAMVLMSRGWSNGLEVCTVILLASILVSFLSTAYLGRR
jgi:hypothetical protein